jgi:hypothetical protein
MKVLYVEDNFFLFLEFMTLSGYETMQDSEMEDKSEICGQKLLRLFTSTYIGTAKARNNVVSDRLDKMPKSIFHNEQMCYAMARSYRRMPLNRRILHLLCCDKL